MINTPKESVSRYISIIYRFGASYLAKEYSKFGIGSGQYMFMINLYRHDGISQEALTELLNIDKGTTAKAIKKLEEVGLVKRVKDENDKRINKIYLTEKALNIKEEFLASLTRWENTLTENLSEHERNEALILLQKIANNIIK